MPTSRKKPGSGFATSIDEDSEKVSNISLDETMFEEEEEVVEPQDIVVSVEETPSIVPTEDPAPRFVQPPSPPPVATLPPVPPAQRRNIPKFSRMK